MNSFCFYVINIAKNLFMHLFPNLVIRLRQPTGTGHKLSNSNLKALFNYSQSVFQKYFKFLGIDDISSFLQGKTVVEIGPGGTLIVPLMFLAYGAKKVICIDRFPLVHNFKKNPQLVKLLFRNLGTEKGNILHKIISINDHGEIEWDTDRLSYFSNNKGTLSMLQQKVDLVVSNAVLEHVGDLTVLFNEMSSIMHPGALMVHAADLGPHQIMLQNPLDFLTIPGWLWQLMTSHRWGPNRARKSAYERLLKENCFEMLKEEVTQKFDAKDIDEIKKSPSFWRIKTLSEEDLSCRGILFSARKM